MGTLESGAAATRGAGEAEVRPGLRLALGMPVACRDGAAGRLERVLLDPRTRALAGLVVATGVLRHRDVLVPLSLVAPTPDGSAVLNVTQAELARLRDQSADELRRLDDARSVETGARVECTDGDVGRVEGVMLDPSGDTVTAIVVREGRLLGPSHIAPAAWIVGLAPTVVMLSVPIARVVAQPEPRADGEILADVRAALEDDDPIRQLGLRAVDIVVAWSTVILRGHSPSRMMADRMVGLASAVRGVLAVDAQLVADDELEVAVAAALAHHPLTREGRPRLHARLGVVTVGGVYPSAAAHDEALRLAAQVPGVVAVVDARTGLDPLAREAGA